MSGDYAMVGGKRYDLVPADPPPVDPPTPVPTWVRIGSAVHALDAVNPTSRLFPGGRGTGQLVAYRAPVVSTGTNQHGREVRVGADGKAMAGTTTGNATVPAGGYVLSGHDDPNGTRSATWLAQNAPPGAVVELGAGPMPTPAPVPSGGGKTLAAYLMDGVGHIGQIPAECTQARVAFLQGTRLVEWGGDTPAQTASDLTRWRTGARQTLVAIGGQGGAVTMGGLVGAFHDIENTAPSFPVNGPDWDVEATSLDVASVAAVSKELAAARGDSWATSFVPSGGDPVAVNLDAAKRCQQAGLRVLFGQQLYDTRIDLDAVIRQTRLAVNALGAESVMVGCMVGSDPARYSTVDQWVTYMQAVVDQWPDIAGAYLWESSRPGTAEWAKRVGAVLGIAA